MSVSLFDFKVAYFEAVKDGGDDKFTLEGHEFLIAYAKYLVEYLEGICRQRRISEKDFTLDFTRKEEDRVWERN